MKASYRKAKIKMSHKKLGNDRKKKKNKKINKLLLISEIKEDILSMKQKCNIKMGTENKAALGEIKTMAKKFYKSVEGQKVK